MKQNFYRDLHSSILSFTSALASQAQTELADTFTSLDLDAYVDEQSLPTGHLIGQETLSSALDEGIASVSGVITVGTSSDTNNMLLVQAVSLVLDALRPAKRIPFLDAKTGMTIGHIDLMSGTIVLPVAKSSNARNFQSVSYRGAVTLVGQ